MTLEQLDEAASKLVQAYRQAGVASAVTRSEGKAAKGDCGTDPTVKVT